MESDKVWDKIVSHLIDNPKDISTVPSNNREPLWFYAFVENGNIYVQNSIIHIPSTKMSKRRKIIKKDFITVFSYYQNWLNDRHIRQELRKISRNTAYILGLIERFNTIGE